MLFAVYVDDIITATNSNKKMEKLKKNMKNLIISNDNCLEIEF